jgi:uridine kinase
LFPVPTPVVPAQAVLLAGPSGSGKSTLAAHLGWPVLRLDDFYREGGDPLLPRDAHGRVDWDHPNAWNADAALAAITELARRGEVCAPVYELGADRVVGAHRVELAGAPLFLAEGLFADRLVAGARAAGVLADAVVLAPAAATTFLRRLARDVAEARKPWPVLVRRGLRLWREHAAVVARCERAGMRRLDPARARADLATLPHPAALAS